MYKVNGSHRKGQVSQDRGQRDAAVEVGPEDWDVWADDVERAQLEKLSEVGWIGRDGLIGVEKKGRSQEGWVGDVRCGHLRGCYTLY